MTSRPTGPVTTLRRIRASRPTPAGERCEMCGNPVAEEHQHVVDLETRALSCTCRACYLLFTDQQATLRYRSVPDRYLSFPDVDLGAAVWEELRLPVGLAFVFHNSRLDRSVVFYPGPAGATESELDADPLARIRHQHPELDTLLPDVEALLLHRGEDSRDDVRCLLVPIDVCYELVGTMRATWRGFDGGSEARRALAAFLVRAEERAEPVRS